METLSVVARPTLMQRLFGREPELPAAEVSTLNVIEVGSSGTEIMSGYIQEDYLPELSGSQRADVFDKMRRSDADVKMALGGIVGVLMGATCEIEAASQSDEHKRQAEFIAHTLFNDPHKDFEETKEEGFSMLAFGHAVFEVTHRLVFDHPKFGTYIGLNGLGWRSPKTIERWNVDRAGCLRSISQYAYGDLDRKVVIPGQNLLCMAIGKEGDNYEGVSLLRPAYGAWFRKQLYLKLMAIGAERNAVPTATLELPANTTPQDRAKAEEALEKYSSNESNYIIYPQGWKLDSMKNEFDPEKLKVCLEYEGIQIARAMLMHFLMLGTGSSSGSWALSTDLSDFALSSLEYISGRFASPFNKNLIPQLIRMNFGPQDAYPKMKFSGISDKAGKELSEVIKNYIDSNAIEPDEEFESFLRKLHRWPKKGTPRKDAAEPAEMKPGKEVDADPGARRAGEKPKPKHDPHSEPGVQVKKKP